jgi:cytokinesis protein
MRALALTRSFEPEYDEISTQLKEVVRVSESLRDSVALMNILGLILDIGNFMNDANKQATGFKLSSLARLGMIKDEKNESTFADLVERIVRKQYPEWEGFVDDIGGVVTAQKLNVEQLKVESKKYIDNIKNIQSSLDAGNLSDPKKFHPEDRVSVIVQRSMKDARRKAEQLQLYLDEMVRTYDDIMTFYGEDPSDENARRDFFSKLAGFVLEWKKSREKNVTIEETRRRNEASMARKRAVANNLSASNGGNADAGPSSPPGSGAMDSLLEKLRAAAPQARDQRDRRRRARLKDKHQVRVASGQQMPDMAELARSGEADTGSDSMLSPESISGSFQDKQNLSEGEDVAERAASMLQGLRGDGDGDGDRSGSIRVRRRRENADEERQRRRARRRTAANTDGSKDTVPEDVAGEELAEVRVKPSRSSGGSDTKDDPSPVTTPVIMQSPPTPERGSEQHPVELSD